MNPRENDDVPHDDSDEGPLVRGLRIQLIRLQARLDQTQAAAREQAEEADSLRGRLEEVERLLAGFRERGRRVVRLWVGIAALYGASAGLALAWLLRP
jgi:hypothetical protein